MASNLRVDSIVPSTSGNVSIGTATGGVTIPGDLGIAGVLTYEDVTNIDSVGVITARSGGYLDIRTGSSINTNATGSSTSGTIHKNTNSGEFAIVSGGTGGNNHLTFYTSASAAPTEKLRIGPVGQIGIAGANYGTSGQVLTSQGNSSAPTWANAGGVTMLDTYYLTSNMSLTGGNWNDIKTNFTRLNGTDINRIRVTAIGTGLGVDNSGSASIFSFPSTGYYEIVFNAMFSMNNSSTSRYIYTSIKATNNNSNYNNAINNISSFKGYGNTTFHYATVSVILDITDISNDKFHLSLLPEINMDCNGNTGELATFMQVKRISDT